MCVLSPPKGDIRQHNLYYTAGVYRQINWCMWLIPTDWNRVKTPPLTLKCRLSDFSLPHGGNRRSARLHLQ